MVIVRQLPALYLICQGFLGVLSRDLFVSHSGNDSPGCGHSLSPCASIRFAVVNVCRTNDTINIDYYQGKPYEECSNKWYISIWKSLSFIGRNGKAVIQCDQRHTLFFISGKDVKTVSFENLVLRNAAYAIVQRFTDSNLIIKTCDLRRNRRAAVLLTTAYCLLTVFNSTFKDNHHVGIYGRKCFSVRANITSSDFDFSKVVFEAYNDWHYPTELVQVFISRCNFFEHDGDTKKQRTFKQDVLVRIAYEVVKVVNIKIHQSLFTNFWHENEENATALYIYYASRSTGNRNSTRIILDRLRFENINCLATAVTILEFYIPRSRMLIDVVNSVFHNNANGAMRIYVSQVRYTTSYLKNVPYLHIKNNTFIKNHFLEKQDPNIYRLDTTTLCLKSGKFGVISNRFIDNSLGSSSSASVVYLSNHAMAYFQNCYFENSQVRGQSVQIYAASQSVLMFVGRNNFNMRKLKSSQTVVHHGTDVMPNFGYRLIPVRIIGSFIIQCPKGYSLHSENRTAKMTKEVDRYLYLSLSCRQCPPKTYSLERGGIFNHTIAQINCHSCPRGGICGEGKVKAKPNFWGYKNRKRLSFLACPPGYCCNDDECKSYNSCHGNRTGKLCGRCPKGMSEPLFHTVCKANEDCKDYVFWIGVVVLILLWFVFFLYHNEITTYLRNGLSFKRALFRSPGYVQISEGSSSLSQNEENKSNEVGYLKIIFYYYQIVHVFQGNIDSTNNQNVLSSIQDLFTKGLNLIIGNIRFLDCPLQNITPVKKSILLHSMGFALLGLSVVTCLFWKLCELVRKRKAISRVTSGLSDTASDSVNNRQNHCSNGLRSFSIRILCAFIHISLLMYSSSAQLVFTLLRCVPFKDHRILFIDGTVQCYQTFQYFLLGCAVVSTLPFFLVPVLGSYVLMTGAVSVFQFCLGCLFPLPFCCYWFYLLVNKNRSQIEGNTGLSTGEGEMVMNNTNAYSRKAVLDLLSGPFRSHNGFLFFCSSHLPWEGVLIFRRLIIVIAFTFIHDSRLRMIVILTICVIILVSHLYVKPFKGATENFLETLSLSILIILCGFTLVKALYHGEDNSFFSNSAQLLNILNLTESILILAPITLVILVVVICFFVKFIFLLSFCIPLLRRKLEIPLNSVARLHT